MAHLNHMCASWRRAEKGTKGTKGILEWRPPIVCSVSMCVYVWPLRQAII